MEDTNSGTGNGLESETIFTKVKRKDEKEEEGKEDEEAKNKVGLQVQRVIISLPNDDVEGPRSDDVGGQHRGIQPRFRRPPLG